MKKTDIAMIILIASVSVLLAYMTAKAIFPNAYDNPVKVKTIDKIAPDIVEPRADIFNKQAINPTVKVEIDETK